MDWKRMVLKNCIYLYFGAISKIEDFDFDNVLLDENLAYYVS